MSCYCAVFENEGPHAEGETGMNNSVGADVMGGGGTVRILEPGIVLVTLARALRRGFRVEEQAFGTMGKRAWEDDDVMAGSKASCPTSRRHGKPSRSPLGGMGNCF
jgi:hypothetical protein